MILMISHPITEGDGKPRASGDDPPVDAAVTIMKG